MSRPRLDFDHPLSAKFRDFVQRRSFVCAGAKSALAKGQMDFLVARDIASAWDDVRIYAELHGFAKRYEADPALFQSFVVVFEGPMDLTEAAFETRLWERVQSLSDKDAFLGQSYDGRVSEDPESPRFSLSFAGQAFFIVGLHPRASRPSRRFATPALVFNSHEQFERLRGGGVYEKLRGAILERDRDINGSVNPMLARHGESSEARQYSGRSVKPGWKCPFDPDQRNRYAP